RRDGLKLSTRKSVFGGLAWRFSSASSSSGSFKVEVSAIVTFGSACIVSSFHRQCLPDARYGLGFLEGVWRFTNQPTLPIMFWACIAGLPRVRPREILARCFQNGEMSWNADVSGERQQRAATAQAVPPTVSPSILSVG